MNTDMSYNEFCLLCRDWQQKYGFLVIDKDIALKDGRYKKGFNKFAITGLVVIDTSPEMNMSDIREREKIAREIEKTSESIRKKSRSEESPVESRKDRHLSLLSNRCDRSLTASAR